MRPGVEVLHADSDSEHTCRNSVKLLRAAVSHIMAKTPANIAGMHVCIAPTASKPNAAVPACMLLEQTVIIQRLIHSQRNLSHINLKIDLSLVLWLYTGLHMCLKLCIGQASKICINHSST